MRGEFDDELGPPKHGRDTELTLGSTALLAIFFGMVLLCGLFFGLGFAVGRYGPSDSPSAPQPSASASTASPASSPKSKPSAVAAAVQEPREAEVASAQSPAAPEAPEPAETASPRPAPQVKPALTAQNSVPQSHPIAHPTPAVQPSAPASQASVIMVQIAAVSHQEDADVLVNALRRRGYPVSVRRQPVDNLLHVQIGPFANRSDANAIRQKLLSDGYNAIVQP